MGFPGGSVVKIEQCKGHQLDPWYGKMPHATEQLNPWVTAPETVLESPRAATTQPTHCNYWSLEPVLSDKSSRHNEKPAHHYKE